jgi:hypothetical protein
VSALRARYFGMTIPPSPLATCRILKDGASFAKHDKKKSLIEGAAPRTIPPTASHRFGTRPGATAI